MLVRHLLDHTAGLDDMRLWQTFNTRPTADTPLSEAFDRDASVLAIRSRPGRQFSYSNISYTLAAMVIESVTGERYEAWLERELLAPLQMRDSTFAFTSQQGPDRDPRLAAISTATCRRRPWPPTCGRRDSSPPPRRIWHCSRGS